MEVNSNDNKILLYEKDNLYEEDYYKVYFDRISSNKLESILNKLNIKVISYIIDDKKYYANNIDELVNNYIKDRKLSEKTYYESRGIYIDGINIICSKSELIKLEKEVHIY